MYLVQSLVSGFIFIILGGTVVDAMDGVISFANFLTVVLEDIAAWSFPPAETRIDTDINLVHNRVAQSLVSSNTTR